MSVVDVLVPTCDRPTALAATLACLIGQTHPPQRVVVSDQGLAEPARDAPEIRAIQRVLRVHGVEAEIVTHLPRRGLAEQRQFLLDQSRAPYVLFLDDDVLLERDLIARLVRAIERAGCGFIGSFVNAPSAVGARAGVDRCPDDLELEPWTAGVAPEIVEPGGAKWQRRHRVHFSAYLHELCGRLGVTTRHEMLYRVAWVGGCVLYDAAKLRSVGGFGFWTDLPPDHVGEDVLAQLLVMAQHGGAGLAPSGAWHQEIPTTMPDRARRVDAPYAFFRKAG
jgi:glycosyltransferase involved in cell wall biosynthesis